MTEDQSADFAVYLAPGVMPLSAHEIEVIHLQTADLLGCDKGEIQPLLIELHEQVRIESEFAWIPETDQCRDPYLALITLLRSGARAVGDRCCMLVHDLSTRFPALDYLKGLAEITRLPVFLAVCRKAATASGPRQILVRRLR